MHMHYPFDQLPAPGTALEVAPGVRWLRMPLPFSLDHVNLWLIADGPEGASESGWAAVDTGIALDSTKDTWRQLLAEYPLTRQFVTHCHPDHLGLSAWLEQQTGAALWITQGEFAVAHLLRAGIDGFGYQAMVAFYARHGLDDARLAALESRGHAFRRGVPDMPPSFIRLREGDEIRIGGHHWRIITGTGHSPEHAAMYCDALHVLISGDMLLPRITTNVHVGAAAPENDALQEYLTSLERFLPLPDDTLVLPSHGRPFRGLHERITQLQQHHSQRCNALLQAAAAAKSATELLPALFDRDISDPHQLQFAMGETIAHLNYLEHQHRLLREDDGRVLRYRAA